MDKGALNGTRCCPERRRWLASDNHESDLRMERFAHLWAGTPYMSGSQVRGVGTDCMGLVLAFLDYMAQRDVPTPLICVPKDCGLHFAPLVWPAVRNIMRSFPSHQIGDGSIRPGDVLILRSSHMWVSGNRFPGHCAIVMPKKGTVLHADQESGVCISSIQCFRGILRTYRAKGGDGWRYSSLL